MTPDKPKCEHGNRTGDCWKCEGCKHHSDNGKHGYLEMIDGAPTCLQCGLRFVPSDVLEEARGLVSEILEWDRLAEYGENLPMRLVEGMRATLARIDGVLGK
jgi:hypothetical protein